LHPRCARARSTLPLSYSVPSYAATNPRWPAALCGARLALRPVLRYPCCSLCRPTPPVVRADMPRSVVPAMLSGSSVLANSADWGHVLLSASTVECATGWWVSRRTRARVVSLLPRRGRRRRLPIHQLITSHRRATAPVGHASAGILRALCRPTPQLVRAGRPRSVVPALRSGPFCATPVVLCAVQRRHWSVLACRVLWCPRCAPVLASSPTPPMGAMSFGADLSCFVRGVCHGMVGLTLDTSLRGVAFLLRRGRRRRLKTSPR
jgi:hypothetical protein